MPIKKWETCDGCAFENNAKKNANIWYCLYCAIINNSTATYLTVHCGILSPLVFLFWLLPEGRWDRWVWRHSFFTQFFFHSFNFFINEFAFPVFILLSSFFSYYRRRRSARPSREGLNKFFPVFLLNLNYIFLLLLLMLCTLQLVVDTYARRREIEITQYFIASAPERVRPWPTNWVLHYWPLIHSWFALLLECGSRLHNCNRENNNSKIAAILRTACCHQAAVMYSSCTQCLLNPYVKRRRAVYKTTKCLSLSQAVALQ